MYHLNKIKIIGGKWRGKNIFISKYYNIKPTTNKARETLFNWLMFIIQGLNCLDCFAGSGALGIEALSRDAANITFIENNYLIFKKLNENIKNLDTKCVKLIYANSLQWLSKSNEIYNVVFIDPPFHQNLVNKTIKILEKYGHLSCQAWIYIETERKNNSLYIPNHWTLYKKKITKKSMYLLYLRNVFQ